jgi:hypothetical protein
MFGFWLVLWLLLQPLSKIGMNHDNSVANIIGGESS